MDYAKSSEFHRFIIPDGCHWNDVRATVESVGSKIKGDGNGNVWIVGIW